MMEKHPLIRCVTKLDRRCNLSAGEKAAFLALAGTHSTYLPNKPVVDSEDQITNKCAIIGSGVTSMFKIVGRNERQVVAFGLPGDIIDLGSVFFSRPTFHVRAETETTVFWVEHHHIIKLISEYPGLHRAFWIDTLVDANIAREWLANIGQRPGRERVAHLLLELDARFTACGLNGFAWPLRQRMFADALGLSLVHLNKSFASLKKAGFLLNKKNQIKIVLRDELAKLARFDDYYLRLAGNNPIYADPKSSRAVEGINSESGSG